MDKVFVDTNVVIALVFNINSMHPRAKNVFNNYLEFYWSYFVQKEFENRFIEKNENLINFFNDLFKYLENPTKDFYSSSDLKNFVSKHYVDKRMNDAKSSINPFWEEYIGVESQISFLNMRETINYCLKDLSINTYLNKNKLESTMRLTPKRTKVYPNINNMLKNEGVKNADRIVTLDGHDFACWRIVQLILLLLTMIVLKVQKMLDYYVLIQSKENMILYLRY